MKKDSSQNNTEFSGELILGIALVVFSLFVIIESIRMPVQESSDFLMSPGFVPLFTGAALLILSLVITSKAMANGAHRYLGFWFSKCVADREIQRFSVLLAITAIYIIGLLGRIHFGAATFIFHLCMFSYLKVGKAVRIVIYSALATGLVAFLLPFLFKMPLP